MNEYLIHNTSLQLTLGGLFLLLLTFLSGMLFARFWDRGRPEYKLLERARMLYAHRKYLGHIARWEGAEFGPDLSAEDAQGVAEVEVVERWLFGEQNFAQLMAELKELGQRLPGQPE